MNLLTIFDGSKVAVAVTLEQLLAKMQEHGKPTLGIYSSGGWHCSVSMHVPTAGVSFEVKSSFDHPTPISAARECIERMAIALRPR